MTGNRICVRHLKLNSKSHIIILEDWRLNVIELGVLQFDSSKFIPSHEYWVLEKLTSAKNRIQQFELNYFELNEVELFHGSQDHFIGTNCFDSILILVLQFMCEVGKELNCNSSHFHSNQSKLTPSFLQYERGGMVFIKLDLYHYPFYSFINTQT